MKRADLVGVEGDRVAFLVTMIGGIGSDVSGGEEDKSSDEEEQRRRWFHGVAVRGNCEI